MNFLISLIGVLVGFFLLIKGADTFVDGASRLARKFGIPSIIIGLTIVAIGTSLPEMMVSITSSLSGKNDMCIANVAGSNLFNICMVLAISSIVMKNKYDKKYSFKEKISSFFRVVFLIEGDITTRFLIVSNAILLFGVIVDSKVGRIDGLALTSLLTLYIMSLIKKVKTSNDQVEEEENNEEISIIKQLLFMVLGSIGIVIGGDLVVESATKIGEIVGLSENIIGLTIVAMGTSLPELVTSLVAIKKGESEIALGNALGSNIFNILLVLGVSSLISPISVTAVAITDIIIVFAITLLVAATLFKRNNILSKNLGVMYVLFYLSYTALAIVR